MTNARCFRPMRKLFGIVFAFLAAATAVLCAFMVIGGDSVDQTVQSSRKIESGFQDAANYINNFRDSNARLPTEAEFSQWALHFPDSVDSPRHFDVWRSDRPPREVIDKFGSAPKDSYFISYWRGEWMEYYASWVNRSTLILDPRGYYMLGSQFADVMLMLVITALFAILAIKTWPKRERSAWDLR